MNRQQKRKKEGEKEVGEGIQQEREENVKRGSINKKKRKERWNKKRENQK